MATLTNDLNFSLGDWCPGSGLFGTRGCRAKDYRSWRKIAIGLRQSLISAKCLSKSTEFHLKVCGWLRDWADLEKLRAHPTAYGVAMVNVMSQADPALQYPVWAGLRMDTAARFPAEPSIEFHWVAEGGAEAGMNYSEITQQLVEYIREGWELYQDGVDDDEITVQSTEVQRAMDRPRNINWFPVVAVGVGIVAFLSALTYGAATLAPVYAKARKAVK